MTIQTFTDNQIDVQQFSTIHNERVTKYFRKNPRDQSEEAQKRQYLRSRLLINPAKDSKLDCIFKSLWFNDTCGFAFSNLAPVYGFPMEQYQSQVQFLPQVLLRFREREISAIDLPLRKYKLEKEISFRLLNEDIPKNSTQLRALANKIKSKFFTGGKAYSYTTGAATGSTVYRYKDEPHGYRLAIEVSTKAVATSLIEKCLFITGTRYDANLLTSTSFKRDNTPEKITVLSNRVNKPMRGRFGKLYLFQVEYKQKGIRDKILLDQMGAIGI